MIRKSIILLSLLAMPFISCGQIIKIIPLEDFDIAVVEQINYQRSIVGQSNLVRSSELDSASFHHAMYLALYYEKFNKFGNHKESYDLPNFEEKYSCWDRYGNPGSEIIDHAAFGFFYKNQSVDEILKSPAAAHLYANPKNMFVDDYMDSPPHKKIMLSPEEENKIGTCSFLVLVKDKNPEYSEYPDLVNCYLVNVTTFK